MRLFVNLMNRFYIFIIISFLSIHAWSQTETEQDEKERDNETEAAAYSTETDSIATAAPELPWPTGAQTEIERLLEGSMFETSQVGLMVYDLTADSEIGRAHV